MSTSRSLRIPATLCLGVLLAPGGCDNPTAPGVATPAVATSSLDGLAGIPWEERHVSVYHPCYLEHIDFETFYRFHSEQIDDATGGFHLILHVDFIGTGVGRVTGTEYWFNGHGHSATYFTPPGTPTASFTSVGTRQVLTRGSATNLIIVRIDHWTRNANGELTSDLVEVRLECVG